MMMMMTETESIDKTHCLRDRNHSYYFAFVLAVVDKFAVVDLHKREVSSSRVKLLLVLIYTNERYQVQGSNCCCIDLKHFEFNLI